MRTNTPSWLKRVSICSILATATPIRKNTPTGVNLWNRKISQPAYRIGPLSAHQRNATLMTFRWWADSGPLLYDDWDEPCHKRVSICLILSMAIPSNWCEPYESNVKRKTCLQNFAKKFNIAIFQ